MIIATFAEKAVVDDFVDVELIKKWISILSCHSSATQERIFGIFAYLGNGSSKYYNFVEFPNTLHELIDTRPLDDVDVMELALDLHGYSEISLVEYLRVSVQRLLKLCMTDLEATVDQCLIQIQD